jgi:hypothetical protein
MSDKNGLLQRLLDAYPECDDLQKAITEQGIEAQLLSSDSRFNDYRLFVEKLNAAGAAKLKAVLPKVAEQEKPDLRTKVEKASDNLIGFISGFLEGDDRTLARTLVSDLKRESYVAGRESIGKEMEEREWREKVEENRLRGNRLSKFDGSFEF